MTCRSRCLDWPPRSMFRGIHDLHMYGSPPNDLPFLACLHPRLPSKPGMFDCERRHRFTALDTWTTFHGSFSKESVAPTYKLALPTLLSTSSLSSVHHHLQKHAPSVFVLIPRPGGIRCACLSF
ncbi:hypothetical protein PISMIDRAFT_578425 [Pisolithus microcarpus 441]|uniref:Uncharacterized protein n=1 Tax=Pisolithus microcarpus 441 TaxID=765257 RepID=A0A0C9Y7F3_9AGAM|nr:hypothetical protein PISMIDRAFT_578425 [Pisolithus microcarpus 441]